MGLFAHVHVSFHICASFFFLNTGSAAKVDAFELIKRFGFERSRAFERIGSLSGGERRRLQLLGVLAKRCVLCHICTYVDLYVVVFSREYVPSVVLSDVAYSCLVSSPNGVSS